MGAFGYEPLLGQSRDELALRQCLEALLSTTYTQAPQEGFEPSTKRLTAARSTTELPRNENSDKELVDWAPALFSRESNHTQIGYGNHVINYDIR